MSNKRFFAIMFLVACMLVTASWKGESTTEDSPRVNSVLAIK